MLSAIANHIGKMITSIHSPIPQHRTQVRLLERSNGHGGLQFTFKIEMVIMDVVFFEHEVLKFIDLPFNLLQRRA